MELDDFESNYAAQIAACRTMAETEPMQRCIDDVRKNHANTEILAFTILILLIFACFGGIYLLKRGYKDYL